MGLLVSITVFHVHMELVSLGLFKVSFSLRCIQEGLRGKVLFGAKFEKSFWAEGGAGQWCSLRV